MVTYEFITVLLKKTCCFAVISNYSQSSQSQMIRLINISTILWAKSPLGGPNLDHGQHFEYSSSIKMRIVALNSMGL